MLKLGSKLEFFSVFSVLFLSLCVRMEYLYNLRMDEKKNLQCGSNQNEIIFISSNITG